MKTAPHNDVREQLAHSAGWQAMFKMNKFGVDLETLKVGTKKPFTVNDAHTLVQAAVRKALSDYQEFLEGERKKAVASVPEGG